MRTSAVGWLGHPVSVGAVVVLAVNDHLLKAAFPGAVTGKVSDVAGLVFAPALLALGFAVFGWGGERAAAVAVAATGAGFTVVKGTALGAAAASGVWTAVAGPSLVRTDPTDLLALPALALSWAVRRRVRERDLAGRWARAGRAAIVVPLAVLATAATSQVEPDSAHVVGILDDRIVVGLDADYTRAIASRDGGLTWEIADGQDGFTTPPAVPRTDPGSPSPTSEPTPGGAPSPTAVPPAAPSPVPRASTCVPGEPRHCYRPVPGRLAVQETTDGRAWRTVWEVSPGRTDFLRREASGGAFEPEIRTKALAVQARPGGGHVVVAANGEDGIAVRDTAGKWRRLGHPTFTSPPTGLRHVDPVDQWRLKDLTSTSAYRYRALFTGLIALALAVGAGIRASRMVVWGAALTLLGAALGFALRALDLLALLFAPVCLVLLATGVVLLAFGVFREPVARRALVVGPIALVSAVLAAAPVLGWTAGVPDGFRTAVLLSALAVCLGTAAAALAGRAAARAGARVR